ncbi:hypothetical protein [Nocardia sp. NPDC051750]|uniref:hypothetical protein n=1 Tax=Nocardia sp. NPDC051750 TaxID=3364325 RepID=UPI0037BD78A5
MGLDISHGRPAWRSTGNWRFPLVAEVAGEWWVLRINGFPDHDLWTLFIDGVVRGDLTAVPAGWGKLDMWAAPTLEPALVAAVLAPVAGFAVYGSEVGQPCDGPFCCG